MTRKLNSKCVNLPSSIPFARSSLTKSTTQALSCTACTFTFFVGSTFPPHFLPISSPFHTHFIPISYPFHTVSSPFPRRFLAVSSPCPRRVLPISSPRPAHVLAVSFPVFFPFLGTAVPPATSNTRATQSRDMAPAVSAHADATRSIRTCSRPTRRSFGRSELELDTAPTGCSNGPLGVVV